MTSTISRRRFVFFLIFVLLIVVATPFAVVLAQQSDAVERAALVYLRYIKSRGYDTIRNEDSDILNQGQAMTYTVSLYGGVSYVLFAAGDTNISDLDIYLYDENYNLIARDTAIDNFPIVNVTPRWTGSFYLQVKNYRGYRGWYHMGIAY